MHEVKRKNKHRNDRSNIKYVLAYLDLPTYVLTTSPYP